LKNVEQYNQRREEEQLKIREKQIKDQMRREEGYLNSNRLRRQYESQTVEKMRAYDYHMMELEAREQEEERKRQNAQKLRNELEKKKEEAILSSSEMTRDVMRSNTPSKLEQVAKQLDIDIEELRQIAKDQRKGRKSSSKPAAQGSRKQEQQQQEQKEPESVPEEQPAEETTPTAE